MKEKDYKTTNIYGFPKQKVSNSQKSEEWHEQCTEALIREASFNSTDKAHLKKLYDAANDEFDDKSYKYVTDPYNSTLLKDVSFPAKLRNYPIISPILNLLMGEKSKRPKNYQVVATNADSVTEAQKQQYSVALEMFSRTFINEANKISDTGIPDQDVETPKQVLEELNANPADKRAIVGQEALDYLVYDLEFIHQTQKLWYDYIVAGECYTYKDISHDNVIYEHVSPFDITVKKAPETEYVEDGEAVIRRKLITPSSVVDRFYDVLKPSQIDDLENPSQNREGGMFTPFYDNSDRYNIDHRLIEVIHVTWKSFKKIGLLTYFDEMTGSLSQMEVDEDYEPDDSETIDWIWVSEVRENYRIDGRFYVGWGPVIAQRNKLDDLSACKLPYNGICHSNRHSKNKSLVDTGLQFQILYNILHYRFELTLAKNKDKITLIPIDAIPKEEGWDPYKFMYFADAMGFAFISPNAEGAKGFSNYQVLDASLSQYAKVMIDLMNNIKLEWEECVGITRQRKGEVSASDTVSGTQEAVFRSSVITEERFRKFEKFEERELQGILDFSKFAWINGKKAMYVNSDMRTAILNVEPTSYMETEMAVFVRNSGKESEKFELAKQLGHAALQNGLPTSAVLEMLDSSNFAKVKDIIRKGEEAQQQVENQMEQARLQQEQQLAEINMQMAQNELVEKDKQREFESKENELDRQNKIDVELIKAAHGLEADNDINDDGVPDAAQILQIRNDQMGLAIEDKNKNRELDIKQQEADTKSKDVDQKMAIEKLKAKTALKNKVAGEKSKPKKK